MRIWSGSNSSSLGLSKGRKSSPKINAKVEAKTADGNLVVSFGKSETALVNITDIGTLEVGDEIEIPVTKFISAIVLKDGRDNSGIISKSSSESAITKTVANLLKSVISDLDSISKLFVNNRTGTEEGFSFLSEDDLDVLNEVGRIVLENRDIPKDILKKIINIISKLAASIPGSSKSENESLSLISKNQISDNSTYSTLNGSIFKNNRSKSSVLINENVFDELKPSTAIVEVKNRIDNGSINIAKSDLERISLNFNKAIKDTVSLLNTSNLLSKDNKSSLVTSLTTLAVNSITDDSSKVLNIVRPKFEGVFQLLPKQLTPILESGSRNNTLIKDVLPFLDDNISESKVFALVEKLEKSSQDNVVAKDNVVTLFNNIGENKQGKLSVILLNNKEVIAETRHLIHRESPNLARFLDDNIIEKVLDRKIDLSKTLLNSIDNSVELLVNTKPKIGMSDKVLESFFRTSLSSLPVSLEQVNNAVTAQRVVELTKAVIDSRENPISLNLLNDFKLDMVSSAKLVNDIVNNSSSLSGIDFNNAINNLIDVIDSTLNMVNLQHNEDELEIPKTFIAKIMSKIGITYENEMFNRVSTKENDVKPIVIDNFKHSLINLLKSTENFNSYLNLENEFNKESLKDLTAQILTKINGTLTKIEGSQLLSEKRVLGDRVEQNIQIPMDINGEMTIVNFKIDRDKESGKKEKKSGEFSKVEIHLDLEGCGEVKSKLEFTKSRALRIVIDSRKKESAAWFRKKSSQIVKSLEKDGVSSVIFNSREIKHSTVNVNKSRTDSFRISG